MAAPVLGVSHESLPGERRVALVPAAVPDVLELGLQVLVETGAGAAAGFPDRAYTDAGARIAPAGELPAAARILAAVRRPTAGAVGRLHSGQLLIGLLRPAEAPQLIRRWAEDGASLLALDRLPEPLGPWSPLDAAAAQASIAGHRAVLVAAARLDRELGGRFTPPARVLVLGAGPAGLRAVETAVALGADVHAHDARPAARPEILARGGQPLPPDRTGTVHAAAALAGFDVIVTCVEPPDRPPPVLVGVAARRGMRAGSVLVDLACGPYGGNVAGSRPGSERLLEPGVLVIGARDLATDAPVSASAAFAESLTAALTHLVPDGHLAIDPHDPAVDPILIAHGGALRDPALLHLLHTATSPAGLP